MIHVCCVKFGTRYPSEQVNRLFAPVKLSCENVSFWCATDNPSGLDDYVNTIYIDPIYFDKYIHWSKLKFFDPQFINANQSDEIIIMDIDQEFVADPKPIIEFPIQEDEVGLVYRWWTNQKYGCPISGGYYKFKANGSTKYLSDKFGSDPDYWVDHYFKNQTVLETIKPRRGEQNFVYDNLRKSHRIKIIPKETVVKINSDLEKLLMSLYAKRIGGDLLVDGKPNPRTILVHYANTGNEENKDLC